LALTYTNPVWPGYLADPCVVRLRGAYYAYGTGGPERGGRQPDGRIFPILRSDDLAHWEWAAGALLPLDDPGRPAYWAPEVAECDGTIYLYYSAGGPAGEGHQVRVATSDQPEGPFVDAGRALLPDEPFSIDPHPFTDGLDGQRYLFFAKDFFDGRAGTGIAVVPLDRDMMTALDAPTTVVRASAEWQVFQYHRHWYGKVWDAWHTVEGPYVVQRSGRCYCFYSGGCWETPAYGVSYAVAESVLGPYAEDAAAGGPRVLRAGDGDAVGPGHASVMRGPGGDIDYMAYHAWDPQRTARRMCLDRLVWAPEGPVCRGPSPGGTIE
jgi:arabinan endo-1,5-alpha-L-arabinosidase